MMKSMRKFVVTGVIILTLVAGSIAAFAAAQHSTPAGAIAGLTGREIQSVIDERAETGKTYGALAREAGVLEAFKAKMLEMKKDTLAARVAAGTLTQEQADAIAAKIEARQATCDGSGAGCELHGAGCGNGAGFGNGAGSGLDCGQHQGQGDQNLRQGCRQGGQGHKHVNQDSQGQQGGADNQGRRQGGQVHGHNHSSQGVCLRDGSCLNR